MKKDVLVEPKKVVALVAGECNLSFSSGRVEVKKFKKGEEFLCSVGAYKQLIAEKSVKDYEAPAKVEEKMVASAPENKQLKNKPYDKK